jgi:hypothetical protein
MAQRGKARAVIAYCRPFPFHVRSYGSGLDLLPKPQILR